MEPENPPVQPQELIPNNSIKSEPPLLPPSPSLILGLPKKQIYLIGGGVACMLLLVLLLTVLFLVKNNASTNTPVSNTSVDTALTPTQNPNQIKDKSSQQIVYGVWSAQSSVIKSLDLATQKTTQLASLPLSIKKVTVLNPKTLMYIDQTDAKDHGKKITFYNINEKTIASSIPAADGFSIYDYQLSPNRKYLVLWEIKPGPMSLTDGRSRIYALDMTNLSISNQLYDEQISDTVPSHYPRAILDTGTVLSDTFLPSNTSTEYTIAYGMSTVDFDGTNRKDIDAMTSGTYSSAPGLSPDGTYLLFAGYDGSQGDGNAVVNGFRQALLIPNTIELLNTKSLARFRLPNVPNDTRYTHVIWDKMSANVIITSLAPGKPDPEYAAYDLAKKSLVQFTFPTEQTTPFRYVTQLPGGKTVIGTADNQPANYGNLGESDAYAFTRFAILDAQKKQVNLRLEDQFLQYITILAGNYFE